MSEFIGEKCAVFGVYDRESLSVEPSRVTYFGLYALQHRGQEGTGIASSNGQHISVHKGPGLVAHVYKEADFKKLNGYIAIGHNRYSTFGGTRPDLIQPLGQGSQVLLSHNGNIQDVSALRTFAEDKKLDSRNLNDSGLMHQSINFFMERGANLEDAIEESWPMFKGAFSALFMTKDKLAAIRDKHGFRPLSIGSLNGGHVFSSETCALNNVSASYIRDVSPGEMVVVGEEGVITRQIDKPDPKICAYEFFYQARPDSVISGELIYKVRKNFGRILAEEAPVNADLVIPVPQSGIPSAIGYAQAMGLPYEEGFMKNQYIGRTFINPDQRTRDLWVQIKINPLADILKGKRVVVIDDSIVRGTTSPKIVRMLYNSGAKEVHLRIASPPIEYPNVTGIDTPTRAELIAANKGIREIEEYTGATSLRYLSLDGFIKGVGISRYQIDLSCFTGEYVATATRDLQLVG